MLCSCIFAAAWEGHADLDLAKALLEKMPALKPISIGTSIRYELLEESMRHAEFEFSKNGIAMYYWFERPSSHIYAKNLLKLLTVASYLRDAYSIDMTSLYGHLVESLYTFSRTYIKHQSTESNIGLLIRQLSIISDMNVRLSAKNALLSDKLKSLNDSNASLEKTLKLIVSAIGERFQHGSTENALALMGLEKDAITAALECCKGDKHANP